jgi:acyl-CoA synthetase (NDP forming)
MLQTLLTPQSIAIIGGSDDLSKPGGRIIYNILSRHYSGQLWIVNPKNAVIQGQTAYPSIPALPAAPDLAFIAVPAPAVRQSLEELAELGTPAVVILSAGFGEVNAEGKRQEAELARIANEHKMLLIGPNCSGLMSYAHAAKFTGTAPEMVKGGIDFLSGSGATIDFLVEPAIKRGLPFNAFLTVGNSAQTSVTDLLRLFDEEHTESSSLIKILYLESIGNPQELLNHARSLVKKGCLLAGIKSGTTQAGSRAAASHTGAMLSNDTAVQALFDKAGIIRVFSRPELIDVANVLTCAHTKLDGKRVCIITDAGGPGVMLADELNRQGLEVPPLQPHTRELLAAILPKGAGLSNPIDCLPARNSAMMSAVLEIICREEANAIDYIAFILGDSGLSDNHPIYQTLADAIERSLIPIFPSLCVPNTSRAAIEAFKQRGASYFEDEVALGRALGRVVNRPRLSEAPLTLPGFNQPEIATLLADQSGVLSPQITRRVLEAAGLRFPGQVELNQVEGLKQINFAFPWVMKVIGPLHKSDVGGVKIGIKSMEEALLAWEQIIRIPGASGVLVQPMISGTEVIIGANREADFGHLVAFGLGGIYTEALKDVQFALAPLSPQEADHMIHSLRAFPLLKGMRGETGLDLDLLKDWIMRIALLVHHFPLIREMDLNPVKGSGSDLYIVDARIILDK